MSRELTMYNCPIPVEAAKPYSNLITWEHDQAFADNTLKFEAGGGLQVC